MWTRVKLLPAGALVLLWSCGDSTRSASDSEPTRAPAASVSASASSPLSDPRYRIDWRRVLGGQAWVAEHPVMGLRSEFGRGQVLLHPAGSDAEPGLSLRASTWGCVNVMEPLPAREPKRSATEPDRVSFGEPGVPIVEWYHHAESGLEHGFTVSQLPACAQASGHLLIALERSPGWSSTVSEDQTQVTFRSDSGTKIHYTDAYARGSLGGVHAVSMLAFEDGVALDVDTRDVELPLEIDPLAWTQQQKVTASDAQDSDFFGHAVALSGNLLASGAPGDDDKGSGAGAVYANARSGTAWGSEQKILASDGAANDNFGTSVAITASYLAAGASLDDDAGLSSGSVYAYTRTGATWGTEKKVVAPDAQAGDQFGSAVALDGTTLVVGAPFDDDLGANAGAAYVFTFSAGNWAFQQKLTASDAGADSNDNFGNSLAISGNTVVVGSPYDSDVMSTAGAAYVFVRSGTAWTQQQKLVADDAKADDYAGEAVAIDANSLVIGAYDNGDKAAQSGTAWVWTRSGATWTKQQKLFPKDPVGTGQFGDAVAIRGDVAVIGATGDDGPSNNHSFQGAAYVFTRASTTWTETTKLLATDGTTNHTFGGSLSLDGTTVAVGAEGFSAAVPPDPTTSRGATYVEALTDGSACVTDTDCHSGHCVENVCCDTACSSSCQTCLASRKVSGADGVCGNVKNNTDPRNACATQTASTCGTTGVCNGSGACTQFANGTECVAAACPTATSQNPADSCNGSGTCVSTPTAACKRGYLCKAGACLPTCATADDCDATQGFTCSGSKCQVPPGKACSQASDCASGFCVDGVCCNAKCDQKCNSCLAADKVSGADGVCGAVKIDADPADECAAAVGDACGADGQCDGQGACRSFAKPQAPCQASSCDGTKAEHPAQSCNGSGKCTALAPVACQNGYLCKAGACATSCTTVDDCDAAAGFECNNGKCKVPQGKGCQVDTDCGTGHCSDGVCCDSACNQQCNSCLAAEKVSGPDGECGPLAADTEDVVAPCAADSNPCGADGKCDGQGSCRSFAKPTTPCGDTTCDAMTDVVTGQLCDGEGNCLDDSLSCAPYVCGSEACTADCQAEGDCHDPEDAVDYVGAFCNASQKCQDKLPDGTECSRLEQCASGNCVDGFCCNKACDGQCEGCAEPGAEGKCVPVLGEPRGERAACAEAPPDEPCLAASCNGKVGDHCAAFASSKVKCQDPLCEDGQATGQGLCDGDGQCSVAAPVECGSYVCGVTECLTSCQTGKDCVDGNSCVDGECLSGAKCSDDGLSVVDVNGTSSNCGAFVCQGEQCLKQCSNSLDCAPGYVCADTSLCVTAEIGAPAEDSGCGCRAAGGARSNRALVLALLGLALWRRRRVPRPKAIGRVNVDQHD